MKIMNFYKVNIHCFKSLALWGGGGRGGGGAGKERVNVKGQKLLDLMAYKLPSSCLTPHYVNAL